MAVHFDQSAAVIPYSASLRPHTLFVRGADNIISGARVPLSVFTTGINRIMIYSSSGRMRTQYRTGGTTHVDLLSPAGANLTSGEWAGLAGSVGESIVAAYNKLGAVDTTAHGSPGDNTSDFIGLGRMSNLFPWIGDLAEAALWNIELTPGEIQGLIAGWSPRRIRGGRNLVFYDSLIGRGNQQAWGKVGGRLHPQQVYDQVSTNHGLFTGFPLFTETSFDGKYRVCEFTGTNYCLQDGDFL